MRNETRQTILIDTQNKNNSKIKIDPTNKKKKHRERKSVTFKTLMSQGQPNSIGCNTYRAECSHTDTIKETEGEEPKS